ncbi:MULTISPECIES: histidine phosphatase family protein [unclassified Pseudomonas]|uniref:lipopolysaccharide core heptose(II)-phosphate phosphatase PmrG n=1 Tax=unclassified Pseudomonas TaxID=196821 RepID=UPI00320A9611
MQQGIMQRHAVPQRSQKRRFHASNLKKAAIGALIALAAVSTWYASHAQVLDVSSAKEMHDSGIYTQWAKGEVMVLIRHAERCDRSHNACLDDPAGITVAGSQMATDVGKGLARLGLENAELLSSPKVRTQQTAYFIFGGPILTQDWLSQCNKGFADAALSHKNSGRNLVLITHSGCIDQLERHFKVAGGQRSSAYASALFISVADKGKARILGQMNASVWNHLVSSTGL